MKFELNKSILEKLSLGELDLEASQIYYFESGTGENDFYFAHYFRNNGWDCNAFKEFCIDEFNNEIDIERYDNCNDAFEAYIEHFEHFYMSHRIDEDSIKDVYNGVEAIAQLREFLQSKYEVFENAWNRLISGM